MATLTTVYGANATLTKNTVPISLLAAAQNYGKARAFYDSYTIGASDEFGTSGLIKMFDLPKNCFVYDAVVACEATGSTGIFDVGWADSAELSGGSAVEALDADGFFQNQDPGAAAITGYHMLSTRPGWCKSFTASVEVQVDWTEATQAGAGKVLELLILATVE